MAAAQPPAQPNPTPTKWQCHICHAGPHTYALTTRCTNVGSDNLPCNHDYCSAHCKRDNDIPPHEPSTRSSPPGMGPTRSRIRFGSSATFPRRSASTTSRNPIRRHGTGLAQLDPHGTSRPRRSAHACQSAPRHDLDVDLPRSRPSMAGWWRCHVCDQMNNPALATGRCWNCAHPGPCPACTRY